VQPSAAQRSASVLLGVLALAGGCGPATGPASSPKPSPDTTAASAGTLAPGGLRATSIYFADGGASRLIPVTRYLLPDSGLARGAVVALLAGPRANDPKGLTSAVPAGTGLLGLVVRDSIATVDLSRPFESGAGSAAVRMRLAQLTYTLTRLVGVRRVQLRIEGKSADVFSAKGLVLSGLRRQDFQDLAPLDEDPPIVLTEPVPGSTVRGAVVMRGTANVFEAHLGLRVRDPSGRLLASTWTTATCGTGCRGTFEKVIALPDSVRGDLVVEAVEPSAEDGSDLHVVTSRIHRAP
jgi:hypothetical protein